MKTKEQLDADTRYAFQMALKGHKQFEWLDQRGEWRLTPEVRSTYPHRIYHDIPEGWTRHDGEDWKGDEDAVIEEVMFCDGRVSECKNNPVSFWTRNNSNFAGAPEGRIYAYKLAEKKPEIPEGFIPWSGGECPVAPDAMVEIIQRVDREKYTGKADIFRWSHVDSSCDIIAYRVIEKKVIPWTVENFPRNLWVKRKGGDSEYLVIAACKEEGTLYLGGEWVNFYKLMSNYLQIDGSPCGTEVEQ